MAKEEPADDGFIIGGASKLSSPAGSNRVIFASGSANSWNENNNNKIIIESLGTKKSFSERVETLFLSMVQMRLSS